MCNKELAVLAGLYEYEALQDFENVWNHSNTPESSTHANYRFSSVSPDSKMIPGVSKRSAFVLQFTQIWDCRDGEVRGKCSRVAPSVVSVEAQREAPTA